MRYISFGTCISNRAPFWYFPVSRMEMLVMDRISMTRKRPRPVFFPNPLEKIRAL